MDTSGEQPERKADADLFELLRLLWTHKLVIIGCALVCGGIAVALALTATVMYRAEATVTEVVDQRMGGAASLANQFGGLASLVGVNLSGLGSAGEEAKALLNSRKLCEEFVVRQKLIPVLYPPPAKQPTLWMAVKHFQDDVLIIREDKRAGVTKVGMTWENGQLAARWANDFVSLANELLRQRAMTEAQASIDYLNKHLANIGEVEVRKVMYGLVESETKTLMLASVRSEYALANIDPAVAPDLRFSPKRTIMVILGTLLGGILGVMLVLGLKLFRRLRAGDVRAAAAA